jgi:glycerol-3-phosphate dehydrogenase (NAD(P)+)
MSEIAIIGAGAWGTGLSIALGRRGTHRIRLWAHEKEVRDSIELHRVNELFLPGCPIPACVSATGSLQEALQDAAGCAGIADSTASRRWPPRP